eukprot:Em0011g949a
MWSQPGGEVGTTYTLSYTYQGPCAGAGGGGSVSIGNATQYAITGLQEFSAYILTITASIGVGSSPPASVQIVPDDTEMTPSAPPNNLTEVTKTSSSVTISWGEVPCQDQNSVIVEYRVLYGAVTSAPGPVGGLLAFNNTFTIITLTWQPPPVPNGVIIMYQVTYSANGVVNTYNTTTPPVIITGLNQGHHYKYRSVQQIYMSGLGTYNYSFHSGTVPSAHVAGVGASAINTTSVRVSWLAVQLPPDGILTGYTVYYLSLPNTSKRQSGGYTNHTFPPTSTSGDINNLNPNGVYQFGVVAQVTIMGQLYSGEMDTSFYLL